jgi:16S rRNA (uracil1498-N3)-methyltransferase
VRPRFHVSDIDAGGCGVLADDEAGHLTRVLRLGVGADIDVFDGHGGMFHARVIDLVRGGARVQIVGPAPFAPEPAIRVTLVVSALKGEKMDDVVRDAVMIGVAAVQPVVAARSEVSVTALARAQRVRRWQRIAVASIKQCGRATVPMVRPPLDLLAWVGAPGADPVLVLQEPSAGTAPRFGEVPRAESVQLLIGPEGGWSPEECAAFQAAGFRAISLGSRTLRADAASLVALAALYESWDGW